MARSVKPECREGTRDTRPVSMCGRAAASSGRVDVCPRARDAFAISDQLRCPCFTTPPLALPTLAFFEEYARSVDMLKLPQVSPTERAAALPTARGEPDDRRCCSRSHVAPPRRDRATRRGRGQPTGDELGAEADAGIRVEGGSPSSSQPRPHAEHVDDGSG